MKFLVLAVFVAFLLWRGLLPGLTTVHSDFANYYTAARLVATNQPLDSIYHNSWFQVQIKKQGIDTPGKFAPFPPISAFFMLPLAPFDALTAQRVFTLLNLVALVLGIRVVSRLLNWSWIDSSLLFLCFGSGLSNNFAFGQVYLIMTVSLLWAFYALPYLPRLAALLISFFTAFKYIPVLLLAGFGALGFSSNENQHEHRESTNMLRWSAIFLSLLLAFQLLWFGWPVCRSFYTQTFLPHLQSRLDGQEPYSFYFQSWDALLRYSFIPDPVYNPRPFVDWRAGLFVGKLTVGVTLLSSTTYIMWLHARNNATRRAVFFATPLLAAFAFLPVSASYHFIVLLVPLVILIQAKLLNRKFLTIVLALCFSMGFVPYSWAFYLGENVNLVLGFPRLWLASGLVAIIFFRLARHAKTQLTISIKHL